MTCHISFQAINIAITVTFTYCCGSHATLAIGQYFHYFQAIDIDILLPILPDIITIATLATH